MNISKPTALGFYESSPSLTHPSSIDTTGSAEDSPCLWRTILDTHATGILSRASDRFLDLAMALRLERINARDLVSLLAKSGRLVDKETDTIELDAVDTLVDEEHDSTQPQRHLNAIPASTVGRGRGDSSPSPQSSPVNVSREPKRLKTNEHRPLRVNAPPSTRVHPVRPGPVPLKKQGRNGVKRGSGAVKMQKQRLSSAIVHGDFGPGHGTKATPVTGVKDAVPRLGIAVKKPHVQRDPCAVIRCEAISGHVCAAYRVGRHH
jgi:hypothetical protein